MHKIKLLYSHNDFIVVSKPNESSFHDDKDAIGFFNRAKSQFKIEAWPVHRLDKITSGLIIIATSAISASQFGDLFQNNKIKKVYLAISDRKPKKKQGIVRGNMEKSRRGSWKLNKKTSSPAITQFSSCSLVPKIRLFVVRPKTGKTHQIRVALKSIGAPILGDTRYGGNESDRGYLHAYSLEFEWKGEKIKIKHPPTQGKHFLLPQTTAIINSL